MLVTGGDSGCLVTGDFSGCLATGGETGCLVTGDTGFLVTKVVLLLVWVSSKDWRFCNTGFIYNKKNNYTDHNIIHTDTVVYNIHIYSLF